MLARLASRRVCGDCGANYSVVDNPPRVSGICDVCGGEVVQRDDDTEAAIRRRLELYERETAPLIDWYGEREILAQIQASRARPTRSPSGWSWRSTGASCSRAAASFDCGRGAAVERTGTRKRCTSRCDGVSEEIAKMRRAGRVVAEMHAGDPGRGPARGDHASSSTGWPARSSTAGAPGPTS